MAALPAPTILPPEILAYRPARLSNGCMVEAVVFADFFMAGEFDGPKSWAQAVFIQGRLGGKKFDHAVALFQFRKQIFLWDIEWGTLPLDLRDARTRGSLTELAESTYNTWLSRAAKLAARGQPPVPKRPLEPDPTVNEIDTAAERLGATRPTLRVSFVSTRGAHTALSFVVGDRLFLYQPEQGTNATALSGDIKFVLEKLVRAQAGEISQLTFSDMRLLAALPERASAAAVP